MIVVSGNGWVGPLTRLPKTYQMMIGTPVSKTAQPRETRGRKRGGIVGRLEIIKQNQ
jgi:hypothetical protein